MRTTRKFDLRSRDYSKLPRFGYRFAEVYGSSMRKSAISPTPVSSQEVPNGVFYDYKPYFFLIFGNKKESKYIVAAFPRTFPA